MVKEDSFLKAVLGKYLRSSALAAAALLLVGNAAWAGEGKDDRAAKLIKVIPVPPIPANNNTAGALYSFDISWVDQATQTYYLADRSNKAVQVVDAKTGTLLTPLQATPPFRGFLPCSPPAGANDCAGPNGVVTAEAPYPWLFVTDAGSRVVTINVKTGATVADIVTKTGDPTRADELA